MEILDIQEEILDFLLWKHQINPSIKFTTRRINRNNKLENKFWFIGNEKYFKFSFWEGKDGKTDLNNLGFTIRWNDKRKEVHYNFSSKFGNGIEIINILVPILNIPKVENPNYNYWEKCIIKNPQNILEIKNSINDFINNEKEIIDKIVSENPDKGIKFISDEKFKTQINKINKFRL